MSQQHQQQPVVPDEMFATFQNYVQLLQAMLTTLDNDFRRHVENAIVKSLKFPQTANFLVQVIQSINDCDAGVRQLAAVLLRKKVLSLYRRLDYDDQEELKRILIRQLADEPERIVRLSIAHVVCVLARLEIQESGTWSQLEEAIVQSSQSPNPEHRELSTVLCHSLAANVDDASEHFLKTVGTAMIAALQDPLPGVRLAAVKAVERVLDNISDESETQGQFVHEVIPLTLRVVKEHVESEDNVALVMRTMDVLELIVDLHASTHSKELLEVIEFMRLTALNRNANLRIREHAIHILELVVHHKPKMIVKGQLLVPLLDTAFSLVSEDEIINVEQEVDIEADEMNAHLDPDDPDLIEIRPPSMWAGAFIITISEIIPTKHVMPVLMPRCMEVLTGNTASALARKGALVALGCAAKNCGGKMRKQTGTLLALCKRYMGNDTQEPYVREAAAFALTYFCSYLQPEILTHDSVLVPMLLERLKDPNDGVRCKVVRTLDSLCENLENKLERHIRAIVPALIEIIPSSSAKTQKSICSALSSVAQAQCPGFPDLVPDLFNLLRPPMENTSDENIPLRAQVTETIGIMAAAVGKEKFEPYFIFFMEAVQQNFTTKHPVLREFSFGFMANMCELLEQDFTQFFEPILRIAFEAVCEDTATYKNLHPLHGAAFQIKDDEDSEGEFGDDGEDMAVEEHMRVRTADSEEKSAAVHLIGIMASKLPQLFAPFAKDVEDELATYVDHYHNTVAENAIVTLTKVAIARYTIECPNQPFLKVVGYPQEDLLPPQTRDSVDRLLQATLLPTIKGDPNKEVVAAACDCVRDLAVHLGACSVHMVIDDIVAASIKLLREEMPCQVAEQDVDDDDAGGDGAGFFSGGRDAGGGDTRFGQLGSGDHDDVLIDAVTEMIGAIVEAYGPSFAPMFNKIAPELLPYCSEERSPEDNAMAASLLAQSIFALGKAGTPYFDTCLEIAVSLIENSDESAARSNSCFLCRALVESLPHCMNQEKMGAMLTALWSVASSEDEIPEAIDNAVSATCSIARCSPSEAPVDHIFPEIIKAVPTKVDKGENRNCLESIVAMIGSHPTVAMNSMQGLVRCVGKTFVSESVESKVKQLFANGIQRYLTESKEFHDAFFQAVSGGLPRQQQEAISRNLF